MRRWTVALWLFSCSVAAGCDRTSPPLPLATSSGPPIPGAAGQGAVRRSIDASVASGAPTSFDGGGLIDFGVLDTPTTGTCAVACDCPQTVDCVDGLCSVSAAPVYCCSHVGCPAGNRCVTPTGGVSFCGALNQTCVTLCDCPQGLACVGSVCVLGVGRVFCCDRPGCPGGQPCETVGGGRGICGTL